MAQLPDYVASATPNPAGKRAGWLATTAAGNAGVMLWFVFWQNVPQGGTLTQGLGTAIAALVAGAAICFALFFYVPARLGAKTGLPLYIVGTSVYGVGGGFYLPGLLMGILQYGWLAVNGYFSSLLLTTTFGAAPNSAAHLTVGIVWTIVTAFVGLKGMGVVGKVASYLPIIPIAVLLLLLVKTVGGIGGFKPELAGAAPELFGKGSGTLSVFHVMITFAVGFFATLGAAGCDFGSGNRGDTRASALGGGGVGVFGSMVATGIIALIAIAGALASANPELVKAAAGANPADAGFLAALLGEGAFTKVVAVALVVSAFPAACVSSLIGANSFKTVFPKINPLITCGVGTAAAIGLVVTKIAADAPIVFNVIGASFGPVCGALAAEYLLTGKKWAGPRAGWNLAGWISWFVGFVIGGITPAVALVNFFKEKGATPLDLGFTIPVPPVTAFVVGFALYFLLAGLRSKPVDLPQRIDA
jgi:cytosine permease